MSQTNAIDKLDTHHLLMIQKTVFEGATTSELAHEFGLNESYIGQLKASECWKLKQQELQSELKEGHLNKLQQLRGPAIKAYEDGLHENQDISIRIKSAKDILDRTGFNAGVDLNVKGNPIINLFRPSYLMNEPEEESVDAIDVTVEEKDEEN